MINPRTIREQFPIFNQKTPNGMPLIYLDSAATTQKPQVVIDAIIDYYSNYNSNVGRGTYWPATKATSKFEGVREIVRAFINADATKEIIFNSGTTDGINKVVQSYLLPNLNPDDEVIVSELEHHGNFVPWQQACISKGAKLRVIPMTEAGDLDYQAYENMLSSKVKMVAVSAVSNALGIVNDIQRLTKLAHSFQAKVLIDAAQLVTHQKIDVQAIDCDFLVFSAHKLFGPTGVGVLHGKKELLEAMPPMSFGGGIVKSVTIEATTFADLPNKHEGGTSNIAGVIGLGAAIQFVDEIGLDNMHMYTKSLTNYAAEKISQLEGMAILGKPKERASIISLTIDNVHPHDVSAFLGEKGIAIRAGHHCAQPLMDKLKVAATCRLSFAVYNTTDEIDETVATLIEARDFFA